MGNWKSAGAFFADVAKDAPVNHAADETKALWDKTRLVDRQSLLHSLGYGK